MKVTEQTQVETRKKILAASLEEFSSNGFEGAKMRAIAKKAGLSLGTTYNYFKNKDEILKELIVKFFENREHVISEARQKTSASESTIQTFLQALIDDVHKNPMFYRLHLGLMLQPKIFERIKSEEYPFKELQEKDQQLFETVSKIAKKDLNIDGSLMMIFAMGIITVSLVNERAIDVNKLPNLLIKALSKNHL